MRKWSIKVPLYLGIPTVKA